MRVMIMIGLLVLAGCASQTGSDGASEEARLSRSGETQRQSIQSQETLVPYTNEMTYPGDWVTLTRRRAGE